MYALWDCNVRVAICLFLLGLINPNAMTPVSAYHLCSFSMTLTSFVYDHQTLIYQMRIVLSPWPVWGCESYIQDYDDSFIEFAYALSLIPPAHASLLTAVPSRTQTREYL